MVTTDAAAAEQARGVFLVLALPFFLNDIAFLALDGSEAIYLADYATRALVLGICFAWPLSRSFALDPLPRGGRPALRLTGSDLPRVIAIILGLTLLTRLAYHYLEVPFIAATTLGGLFEFGEIGDPALYWLDLTIGLLAVAASEELVFRKIALRWLEQAGCPPWQILLTSSLFFSLMHWGSGPGRLIYAFAAGLLFMAAYRYFRRLWPVIAAHWLVDFIAFGPPGW